MGMTIVYYTTHSFSGKFIMTELFLIIFCRIFTIFGQIYLLELCGVSPLTFKLKPTHKSFLTGVGSIRGVVSFGLCLLMITPNEQNKNLLVGSTIYIVFLTNILCILISPLFKRREKDLYDKEILQIETGDDKAMKHDIFTFLHPNTEIMESKPKNNQTEEPEEKQSIISRFIEYDDRVIRKKMIPHWPQVKEDNNNISRKIKKALGIWAEQKEKSHTYKENDTIGIDLPGFNKNWKRDENEEELDKSDGKNKKKKIELQDINT
jgi:NhaP-type Na+/H+ or K+/H+ antiporter